ncbi:MAG: toxin-activating lysine-acyltransferase [Betaproteobacteria bacterium]|nr:toxin-activating lysine-acyltransferase [Betaproteobacteria bacterium]MCL2162557.1 toxin-activating lysine-acyltransferase [Betaproteobacteria bacterium]
MRFDCLDVIAPGPLDTPCDEPQALGSAVWLMMHSASHREMPLWGLSVLLLPAIKHRQFVLASEQDKPVFFITWAKFSPDAERRYLANPPLAMPVDDWNCGDRIWILDWIAPFGHTRISRSLMARLFPTTCARSLYHRGETRGLRVMEFHGIGVTAKEARAWSALNPPLLPAATAATSESLFAETQP